nr:YdcF family protein [Butyrivibrio sp.]
EGGKEYLVSLGIPEDRIIVEGLSADTVQNIENAYALIQEDIEEKAAKGDTIAAEKSENPAGVRIGVVTNGFHVFRGVHIAKHVTGYEACGIAAFMQLRFLPNNLVRESLGIIRDLLKGDLL